MSSNQLKIHYPWEDIQLEMFSEDPIQKELQEVLSQCPKCNLEYNDDCEICNGHFPEKDEE